ncbi:hypothetical protein [Methylobacterium nigriterrae]|uniref:hypothetical protein n=1 Tax=Methylobacterium nigriterrae TaxID=3127512 RepID=UPI0030139421
MLPIAVGAYGLHRYGEPYRAEGGAYFAAATAAARKSVQTSMSALFSPPDAFSVAYLERGGTTVQVRSPEGALVQRCALKFDDELQR